ncbi:hypothetical protein C0081_05060 [Cohaesibacter celericrescens]|uniref:Uncharacterized protein n=1 Tax=Cohaesibacter celericrescens TaxID=2067669 RepID=A0A2N5XUU3_9HYPH|nr:hypothetical protein C0081_05060 [Cohaesibacter celericrescens]
MVCSHWVVVRCVTIWLCIVFLTILRHAGPSFQGGYYLQIVAGVFCVGPLSLKWMYDGPDFLAHRG